MENKHLLFGVAPAAIFFWSTAFNWCLWGHRLYHRWPLVYRLPMKIFEPGTYLKRMPFEALPLIWCYKCGEFLSFFVEDDLLIIVDLSSLASSWSVVGRGNFSLLNAFIYLGIIYLGKVDTQSDFTVAFLGHDYWSTPICWQFHLVDCPPSLDVSVLHKLCFVGNLLGVAMEKSCAPASKRIWYLCFSFLRPGNSSLPDASDHINCFQHIECFDSWSCQ